MKIPIFKSSNEAILFGLENRDKKICYLVTGRKIRVNMLLEKCKNKGSNRSIWLACQLQFCNECFEAMTGQFTEKEYNLVFR